MVHYQMFISVQPMTTGHVQATHSCRYTVRGKEYESLGVYTNFGKLFFVFRESMCHHG